MRGPGGREETFLFEIERRGGWERKLRVGPAGFQDSENGGCGVEGTLEVKLSSCWELMDIHFSMSGCQENKFQLDSPWIWRSLASV